MGLRPSPRHTLDRIDGDGDYEPANTRWATWREQRINQVRMRLIEWDGRKLTAPEWQEVTGIPASAINRRLRYGWSTEAALTIPIGARKGGRPPRVISILGISNTLANWARWLGVRAITLRVWLSRGRSLEQLVCDKFVGMAKEGKHNGNA